MKKHGSTVILIIMLLVGFAVLLYPSVSNYVNSINASRAIVTYDESAKKLTTELYEKMINEARTYNENLVKRGSSFKNGEPSDSYYSSLLNITGDSMIGYVTIRKLNVNLPVYHGTPSHALSFGTGHLEGSSLPVGGESTHAVITGHRGLPAAQLFTDLDRMEIGDTFELTVLNEKLTYIVDKIFISEPDNTEEIKIIPGEDYATLITCTPYAVNTHRLLVRGTRTDTPKNSYISADAAKIDPLTVAPIIGVPLALILLVLLPITSNRRKKREKAKSSILKGKGKNI